MEGRKCKMYYRSGGTHASPTWTEITRITDPKLAQSRSTSDTKFRGAKNVKTATGYQKYEITFQYKAKKAGLADTVFDALQASFDDETVLDIAMVDRAIATVGAVGIRGPYMVTNFERSEADEEDVMYDVTLNEYDDEQAGELFETAPYETEA